MREENIISEELEQKPEFALGKSPGGKPCVEMSIGGKKWILYATMPESSAEAYGDRLYDRFDASYIKGKAFNWRESIASNQLVPYDQSGFEEKQVSLYVSPENFDKITSSSKKNK